MLVLVLFGIFVFLLLLNFPLAFCLGISSLVWLILSKTAGYSIIILKLGEGLLKFPLIAIPLFMLMSFFMNIGGVTKRLTKLAEVGLGFLKGGLAHVNVLVSMFFAGITGSGVADTVAIGGLLIPEMRRTGYSKEISVAVTAVSSVIGVVIPPSIPLIIYGITADVSIGALFLAGIIPGVLLGISQMTVIFLSTFFYHFPKYKVYGLKEKIHTLYEGLPPLGAIVLVIGGIYGGIFTPTEAAGAAVVYAFILGFAIYKELKLKDIIGSIIESSKIAIVGLFLLANAAMFGWAITTSHVPQNFIKLLFFITSNKIMILLGLNFFLLIVGSLLPPIAAIVILVPTLQPIGVELGMDPVQYGVMVTMNLSLGLATPPVGACLFAACAIAGTTISKVTKIIIPYLIASFIVILIVAYFPSVTMLIPNSIMK